jgi:hypothetical protein
MSRGKEFASHHIGSIISSSVAVQTGPAITGPFFCLDTKHAESTMAMAQVEWRSTGVGLAMAGRNATLVFFMLFSNVGR